MSGVNPKIITQIMKGDKNMNEYVKIDWNENELTHTANVILEWLNHNMRVADFKQVKKRNCYMSDPIVIPFMNAQTGEITEKQVIAIKSYNTIVGFILGEMFVEIGKYSKTTSKQMTQLYNELSQYFKLKRYFVRRVWGLA